ncbi:unnamed protein product, partial [Rangifer tarandus platyrhynchus]
EIWMSVRPTALCVFRLKQCQDAGDVVAAHAMRTRHSLYHGRPHGTPGLGGRGLAGAAGTEAGDEPHPDPGLAAGRGKVQSWSGRG